MLDIIRNDSNHNYCLTDCTELTCWKLRVTARTLILVLLSTDCFFPEIIGYYTYSKLYVWLGGVMIGRLISDREVTSSIPRCSATRCISGQVVHTRASVHQTV